MDNLPADGTKYLLTFDYSLDILSKSEKFNGIATAGRHRNLNCVYIKHNLFHKNKTGREAELQTTHIVLFKSPRDVKQIDILGRQLVLGRQQNLWYDDSTKEPYGHLAIALRPSTPELLRYCSNVTSFPSEFFVPTVMLVLVMIMINEQNYYTLKLFRILTKKFQLAFLLHCSKEFIRFLCECIVNLIEGNLTGVRKNQFSCFQKQLRKLTSKSTTLSSRRVISGSKAGITILSYIYRPCMNKVSTFFNE